LRRGTASIFDGGEQVGQGPLVIDPASFYREFEKVAGRPSGPLPLVPGDGQDEVSFETDRRFEPHPDSFLKGEADPSFNCFMKRSKKVSQLLLIIVSVQSTRIW
jgi:hypothetical protein